MEAETLQPRGNIYRTVEVSVVKCPQRVFDVGEDEGHRFVSRLSVGKVYVLTDSRSPRLSSSVSFDRLDRIF